MVTIRRTPGRKPVRSAWAVQGIFRLRFTFTGRRRGRGQQTLYEARVLLVDAATEASARREAHRHFARDVFVAEWPAPDVRRHEQSYLGIARTLQLGQELEANEVWWELRDNRPRIEPPPANAAGRRTAASETRSRSTARTHRTSKKD